MCNPQVSPPPLPLTCSHPPARPILSPEIPLNITVSLWMHSYTQRLPLNHGRVYILRRATDTAVGPRPYLEGVTVLILSHRPFDIPLLPSQFRSNYELRSVIVPVCPCPSSCSPFLDRPWKVGPPVLLTSTPQVRLPTTGEHRHLPPAQPTHFVLAANKCCFHVCSSLLPTRRAHPSPACVPPRGVCPHRQTRHSKVTDRRGRCHRPTFEGAWTMRRRTWTCHSAGEPSPLCSSPATPRNMGSLQCLPSTLLPIIHLAARPCQLPTPWPPLPSQPISRTGGMGKVMCFSSKYRR